jgi:ketosteroid isomerase-like protein
MENTEVALAMFEAYCRQDSRAAEALLADNFTFTSPQDDHIDRSMFMKVCFPTADRFASQQILDVAPAADDGVFVLYEYELESGECFRNAELLTVRSGKLVETQVFFGGEY